MKIDIESVGALLGGGIAFSTQPGEKNLDVALKKESTRFIQNLTTCGWHGWMVGTDQLSSRQFINTILLKHQYDSLVLNKYESRL